MSDLSEFSKEKLREFVASCPKAGSIKIGSSQTQIVASKENRAEVLWKPTKRKAGGIHMRGVGGKKFLTETINKALQYSGLGDNDMRLGKERNSGGTGAGVEGGARPSPRLEEQRSSWAEVANNCYSPSPHCQTRKGGKKQNIQSIVNIVLWTTPDQESMTSLKINLLTTPQVASMKTYLMTIVIQVTM